MSVARAPAFFDYLTERENVRLRKEAGDFFPWTEDPILQTYKFTNVQRHHDRTSNTLRELFYDHHFFDDWASILMNCATYRYFGTYEFAEVIGWTPFEDMNEDHWDWVKETARNRLAKRQRVFTGAYVITNQGISAPKQEVVVDYFLKGLQANISEILKIKEHTNSWRLVAKEMSKTAGFGGTGFMTKEVLLDTTYTNFWGEDGNNSDFSYPNDWDEWTPIGPGALRGAARCLGDSTAKPVKNPVAGEVIMMLHKEQSHYFGHKFKLSPTDIQFGLCEFDKYERVRLGQGRPRSKYHAP